jgi:hypothetical protein
MRYRSVFIYKNITFSRRSIRKWMLMWILFMNARRKLGLHAQPLGIQTPALDRAIPLVGEGGTN